MAREERKEIANAERREKREYYARIKEDRKKREEEIAERNAERKAKEAERKRQWELE